MFESCKGAENGDQVSLPQRNQRGMSPMMSPKDTGGSILRCDLPGGTAEGDATAA